MRDYKIGFGKPPVQSRYQPGTSGNVLGRPKREASDLAKCVGAVLNAPMEFVERGRKKIATREEVNLRLIIARAARGDVKAAEQILYIYSRAKKRGDGGSQRLVVTDWLEDFEGETAQDKSRGVQTTPSPKEGISTKRGKPRQS